MLIQLFSYLFNIPAVARMRLWYKELPRAIRSWMTILTFGALCTTALFFYAAFLFFSQQEDTTTLLEKSDVAFSLEEVRSLVQRIDDRSKEAIIPVSIDPGQ